MECTFAFTKSAKKRFLKLEKIVQERMSAKLLALKHHDHLDSLLRAVTNLDPATHRLRIGSYRLLLQRVSEEEFLVLDIGDRKDIYR